MNSCFKYKSVSKQIFVHIIIPLSQRLSSKMVYSDALLLLPFLPYQSSNSSSSHIFYVPLALEATLFSTRTLFCFVFFLISMALYITSSVSRSFTPFCLLNKTHYEDSDEESLTLGSLPWSSYLQ